VHVLAQAAATGRDEGHGASVARALDPAALRHLSGERRAQAAAGMFRPVPK
jgi:hypothetical protein